MSRRNAPIVQEWRFAEAVWTPSHDQDEMAAGEITKRLRSRERKNEKTQ
jgi:hypothetical protein